MPEQYKFSWNAESKDIKKLLMHRLTVSPVDSVSCNHLCLYRRLRNGPVIAIEMLIIDADSAIAVPDCLGFIIFVFLPGPEYDGTVIHVHADAAVSVGIVNSRFIGGDWQTVDAKELIAGTSAEVPSQGERVAEDEEQPVVDIEIYVAIELPGIFIEPVVREVHRTEGNSAVEH